MLNVAGEKAIKRALLTPAAKQVIKKLPNKIITIAGKRSLLTVGRLAPLIGAPIGFWLNWASMKATCKAAVYYYS